MKFTKMHGCGNDYVYVDVTKEMIPDPEETARFVSDRHFGIGSDGLILIAKSAVADFQMIMYNADGSRGRMCGNGIRCVGKYVYDHGLTDRTTITVETLSGIRTLVMTPGADNKIERVRVDMSAPVFTPSEIPVRFDGPEMIGAPVTVDGRTYKGTAVSMGNPHLVIFLEEDVHSLDLPKIGPLFENLPIFPERVNTEFVNVIDRTHLVMRVWERGSGETLACGTGSCAVLAAAVRLGLTENTADIALLGGHLLNTWDQEQNTIFMEGPAKEVFSGEITLPEK